MGVRATKGGCTETGYLIFRGAVYGHQREGFTGITKGYTGIRAIYIAKSTHFFCLVDYKSSAGKKRTKKKN